MPAFTSAIQHYTRIEKTLKGIQIAKKEVNLPYLQRQ